MPMAFSTKAHTAAGTRSPVKISEVGDTDTADRAA